jgi:hypothetical protein
MNFFSNRKKSGDEQQAVYDVMSDPGVSRPSSRISPRARIRDNANANANARVDGNATSTKGYYRHAAGQQYNNNNTMDPNESIMNQLSSSSSLHGRNVPRKGAPVPASNLFVSPAMRTLPVPAKGGVSRTSPQNYGNYNSNHADADTHEHPQNTLSYSQSLSPEKEKKQLSPPQSQIHQHHKQNQNQRLHNIQTSSSSTFDDYLESSSNDHDDISSTISPSSSYSFPHYPGSPTQSLKHRRSDPEMVDTTYSEHYGDAYTGKPLRYIYPQGYGSMRPRSRPWQIALVLCAVFAWLNVFIVGHCSDRFTAQNAQNNNNDDQNANDANNDYYSYSNNQQYDDDAQKIEAKWCGSRSLYFIWVLSVALTGVSCAYCSIIGYVKARDFAIANGRSQPPGMAGKSDYYVQLEEDLGDDHRRGNGRNRKGGSGGGYKSYQDDGGEKKTLKKAIYQADGTPRFFGGQIYKPTQAAVNLTSR